MMKKGTLLFLILTLILGSFSVASAAPSGASQVISSFSIMPLSCSADSDNLVTRRDFAYTLSNILSNQEMEPRATDYVDVTETDEDSGYIYYATVNGFLPSTGNLFCPNDPISFHDFNEAVIKLLSYETIALANGGGETGNLKTVMDLNLYNGVDITTHDTVTVKQFRKLIYNLLTAKVTDFSYSYDGNGNISMENSGNTKTVLSQYFGISRYNGSIVEVNNEKQTAKVTITKNVSNVNPTYLTVGQTYTFQSNGKVDLNFYKNIPVEIWADKDGMIIYIAPQANVEVFYDVIYSVNNDTNPNNAYAINLLDEVEFDRDEKEYKIAPGAQVSYNGEVVRYPVKLAKKYAKIVLIDNEVTFIETWNLQEGGMVKEINNSYLAYTKGEADVRIKNIGTYDDIIVVIEGRSTDRNQIKPGSLFWYYQTDDQLVIVVSEKTIVGNFDSMTASELEIGRQFYPIRDEDSDGVGDVYCSEDGTNFVVNNYDRIFDTQVTCYIDIFGNIRYIKADDKLKGANEFTAYVIGYSQKGFDDAKLKLMMIHPSLEEIYVTLPSDFTNYVDNPATTTYGVTQLQNNLLNGLSWADRTSAYEKLFKFKINSENKVLEIAEPDYFLLFGEAHDVKYRDAAGNELTQAVPCLPAINIPLDHFIGDYRAIYLPDTKTNDITTGIGNSLASTQLFYIRDERFLVLSNVGGKMQIEEASYDKLLAHGPFNMTDVKIAMFGDEKAPQPEFWLLYGDTQKMYIHQSNKYDDVNAISRMYDAETDEVFYQVQLDNGNVEWELQSLAFADHPEWTITHHRTEGAPTELEVGMRVHYRGGALFSDNEVIITEVEEFPRSADGSDMTMEEWHTNIMPGYLYGEIKKISGYRLHMENGAIYHIGNNCNYTGVRFKNGKVEYESIDASAIPAGATIYFNRTLNVNSIFVELTD